MLFDINDRVDFVGSVRGDRDHLISLFLFDLRGPVTMIDIPPKRLHEL